MRKEIAEILSIAFKSGIRQRTWWIVTVFFIITLAIVGWMSVTQTKQQLALQQKAQEHVRKQWESIESMNPHGAAHYGSFAFKPPNVLASIDEGVNAYTGNVLRLEGHVQNEIVHAEVAQSLLISRFGKLKPSLLLQFVIPLLLLFMSFAAIQAERNSGRLKLLLIQGASIRSIIFGKVLAHWLYGLLLLSCTFLTIFWVDDFTMNPDVVSRLLFSYITYAIFYLLLSLFAVWTSAVRRNSVSSLSLIIAVWLMWSIFLPKIWGNASEAIYPLPQRLEMQKAMDEDRSKGIDGHNPSDQRDSLLKQKILNQYGVSKEEDLPINYDGIVMQADEEYGNAVWDKHYGGLHQRMLNQKRNYQWSGSINPFASLQNLSMALSGTDMIHHLDFLKQAEEYRRMLIKMLNDKHAFGGSKTGDWSWKAGHEFFKSVPDFSYDPPKLNEIGRHYLLDVFFLFIWISVLLIWIFIQSPKIEVL